MFPSNKKALRDYFLIQKFVLRISGVSLEENDSNIYKLYSVISMFTVLTYTAVEAYGIIAFVDNIDILANVVGVVTSHVLGIVKVLVLVKNKASFIKTTTALGKGVFAPNFERGGPVEEQLIKRCISYTTRQSVIYWTTVFTVWFFGIFGSTLTRMKSNDYNDWDTPIIPFSLFEIKSSVHFALIWLYQSTCIALVSMSLSSVDLLIVSILAHIKTQFTILKNATVNIVNGVTHSNEKQSKDQASNSSKAILQNQIQERLKEVVIYHRAIIGLTKQFEEIFNILILTVFMANILVLCFTMYHASLYPLSNMKALQDFSYVIAVSVQLLVYCYWGNEVTLESKSVALACYEVDFVGLNVSLQKQLMLMIQRSQRPVILTAGKFANLSLNAYVSMLRLSYSYYMVLKRKHELE